MRKTKAGVSVEGRLRRSATGRLPGALRGCVALEGRLRPVAKYVGWVLCVQPTGLRVQPVKVRRREIGCWPV